MRNKEYQSTVRIRNTLLLLAAVLAVGVVLTGWKAFSPTPDDPDLGTEESGLPIDPSIEPYVSPSSVASTPGGEEDTNSGQDENGLPKSASMLKFIFVILLVLLVADLIAVAALTWYARRIVDGADSEGEPRLILNNPVKEEQAVQRTVLASTVRTELRSKQVMAVKVGPAQYGKTHNIGARPAQQDSLGQVELAQGRGALAVVADGMGGLSGGEQVSQAIVRAMLGYAACLQAGQMDGVLQEMVRRVNNDINRMLGPDGLYKSGSTLVAVLVQDDAFHWLSVGDSRIYLYRNGRMVQLNQEHTLLQEWMPDILNGKLRYEDVVKNPDGVKLTSFVGMGQLKHVDASLRPIRLNRGDRVLLMSDGVFNTLPEPAMEQILAGCPDVQQAADQFEKAILNAKMPGQDNFTAVILGF